MARIGHEYTDAAPQGNERVGAQGKVAELAAVGTQAPDPAGSTPDAPAVAARSIEAYTRTRPCKLAPKSGATRSRVMGRVAHRATHAR